MPCADTEPFTFTAALQTHFAVRNLATHAQHVRVLGLGGKWVFDYAQDARHPRLDTEKEDYVTFGGVTSVSSWAASRVARVSRELALLKFPLADRWAVLGLPVQRHQTYVTRLTAYAPPWMSYLAFRKCCHPSTCNAASLP